MPDIVMISTEALIEKFRYALDNHWGYIWGTAGEAWTEAKQKELEKTTDSNRAQGRKYGSKWIGHTVADCSGLFAWAFRKLGGTMYHGSDTMYKKWCVEKGELKAGKRTDGKPLKPGTAVFVWNGEKYSHVGLYVGNGIVIEAMGTISGVTTSKVAAGKWTHWGELKGVDYTGNDIPEPADDTTKYYPTIKRGAKNNYVKIAQKRLQELGYDLGKWGVDGDFGQATEKAVRAFQKASGIGVDGIIGPVTWSKLLSDEKPPETPPVKLPTYKATISGLTGEQLKELMAKYPNVVAEEE